IEGVAVARHELLNLQIVHGRQRGLLGRFHEPGWRRRRHSRLLRRVAHSRGRRRRRIATTLRGYEVAFLEPPAISRLAVDVFVVPAYPGELAGFAPDQVPTVRPKAASFTSALRVLIRGVLNLNVRL